MKTTEHLSCISWFLSCQMPTETLWPSCCCICTSKCEHLPTSKHQLVVFCITVVVIDTWRSHVTFLSYLLILYSFRVMKSPQCQMNQNNLACIFGPTVVGHGMSEPSPTTIMRDTNTQPKVCVFFNGAFYSELWGDIPRWPRYTGSIS